MPGLTREHQRIIDYVTPQGVTATKTTKGILFRMPNGGTEMLHYTTSDWRATRNFRANLRRNGIEYHGDYNIKRHQKPPYKQSIEKVQQALLDLDPETVTTVQICSSTGMGSATVTHVMLHLGWWHDFKPSQSKKTFVWHPPYNPKEIITPLEDITFDDSYNDWEVIQEVNDEHAAQIKEEQEIAILKAKLTGTASESATSNKEINIPETKDVTVSWAVNLDDLDGSITLDMLRTVYMASGLNVEMRVWR